MFSRYINSALRPLNVEISRIHPYSSGTRALKTTIQRQNIDCVVDVGANAGQFGRMIREIGFTGWIVSFESGSVAYEKLVEVSSSDDRWITHNVALGSDEAKKRLNVTNESKMATFLSSDDSSMPDWYPESRKLDDVEQVDVVRLDENINAWVDEIDASKLLLKIDTQGFDLEVLKGAAGILDKVMALQIEVSFKPLYQNAPDAGQAFDALKQNGFDIVGLYPISRYSDSSIIEVDCIATRPPTSMKNNAQ